MAGVDSAVKRKRLDEEEDEDVNTPISKRTAEAPDVAGPVIGVAKKARNKVFEAIYRELFEHIHDYVAGPGHSSKAAREVAAIDCAEEKFAKVCSPQHGRRGGVQAGRLSRDSGFSRVSLSIPGRRKIQMRLLPPSVRN